VILLAGLFRIRRRWCVARSPEILTRVWTNRAGPASRPDLEVGESVGGVEVGGRFGWSTVDRRPGSRTRALARPAAGGFSARFGRPGRGAPLGEQSTAGAADAAGCQARHAQPDDRRRTRGGQRCLQPLKPTPLPEAQGLLRRQPQLLQAVQGWCGLPNASMPPQPVRRRAPQPWASLCPNSRTSAGEAQIHPSRLVTRDSWPYKKDRWHRCRHSRVLDSSYSHRGAVPDCL